MLSAFHAAVTVAELKCCCWSSSASISPTLLPVRVVDGRVRRVELAVGAARLSFEEGTDAEYVVALARALAS